MKLQLEEGYVARSARQARDLKEATGKLVALERTLQGFVEDFEKERAFMQEQWRTASASMTKEVDGYRRLVDVRIPHVYVFAAGHVSSGPQHTCWLAAPTLLLQGECAAAMTALCDENVVHFPARHDLTSRRIMRMSACGELVLSRMQLKTKESKNIRRLAQEVLLQRSDVETFFISSLKHVREQTEAGCQHDCGHGSPVLEQAKGPPQTGGSGTAAHAGVDISQLTWPQREAVLRLAFAKINNQARQSHFQKLPQHSFAAVEAVQKQLAQEDIPAEALSGLVSGAAQPQLT